MIAALDVGTTKVSCFIARQDNADGLRIVGIGQEVAHGIKAGVVTDMGAAEDAIRRAVERAETMAETRISKVYVSLSGGAPASSGATVSLEVSGRAIDESDIQRAFDEARAADPAGEREIVHAVPTAYELDGSVGIRDPKGMYGDDLHIRLHLITVARGALRNLLTCINRCDLDMAAPVISGYASGLACLVEDEMDLGVTLVDMGGGTTSLAAFFGGALVHAETIPLGGCHVTNDVARGLSTPVASAERMKRLFGSSIGGPADDREMIEVPQLGESDPSSAGQISRSLLVGIVRPRVEEIFELVRDRIDSSGVGEAGGRRVVLTGGGSQLQGVRELAGQILEKQIRLARPLPIPGLPRLADGPECATCAGLLLYAERKHNEPTVRRHRGAAYGPVPGPIGRISQWLHDNF